MKCRCQKRKDRCEAECNFPDMVTNHSSLQCDAANHSHGGLRWTTSLWIRSQLVHSTREIGKNIMLIFFFIALLSFLFFYGLEQNFFLTQIDSNSGFLVTDLDSNWSLVCTDFFGNVKRGDGGPCPKIWTP